MFRCAIDTVKIPRLKRHFVGHLDETFCIRNRGKIITVDKSIKNVLTKASSLIMLLPIFSLSILNIFLCERGPFFIYNRAPQNIAPTLHNAIFQPFLYHDRETPRMLFDAVI